MLRNDSVVTLFGAGDHPLEILEGHFVVHWDKEGLVRARETSVKVKDTTIHVVTNHEAIPEVARDKRDDRVHKDGQICSDSAIITLLFPVGVESEEVTGLKVLRGTVSDENKVGIKHSKESGPSDDFVEVFGVAATNLTEETR